ncbi:polysaccharide deacetylase family protein [Streptomyces sp. NPDC046985]|uniref:polysaccharide deacetylase family protein n=1 Tax=Streptomyces sp. NPDC046985 TaxID=3155377 RepID=UPI00340EC37D
MISLVRRFTAGGALSVALAALAACGTAQAPHAARPAPYEATSIGPGSTAVAPAPTATRAAPAPMLPQGRDGRAPVFFNGPRTQGKTVAFTFDADMTADEGDRAAKGERFDNPGLIDTLRSLDVPATVFMTGKWAETYPDEARAMGQDPLFEIGNHSYSHYAFTHGCYGLPTVSNDKAASELQRTEAAFTKAGVRNRVPYFRFPGGCYDNKVLRTLGALHVTAVQWDVVSGDAFASDANAVAQQVLKGVKPGSVVVMHCTRSAAPTTEHVVSEVVPELRKQGYRFVKVSDMIRSANGRS